MKEISELVLYTIVFLFLYKMGVHWYFWFAVITADKRDKIVRYKALKQM